MDFLAPANVSLLALPSYYCCFSLNHLTHPQILPSIHLQTHYPSFTIFPPINHPSIHSLSTHESIQHSAHQSFIHPAPCLSIIHHSPQSKHSFVCPPSSLGSSLSSDYHRSSLCIHLCPHAHYPSLALLPSIHPSILLRSTWAHLSASFGLLMEVLQASLRLTSSDLPTHSQLSVDPRPPSEAGVTDLLTCQDPSSLGASPCSLCLPSQYQGLIFLEAAHVALAPSNSQACLWTMQSHLLQPFLYLTARMITPKLKLGSVPHLLHSLQWLLVPTGYIQDPPDLAPTYL